MQGVTKQVSGWGEFTVQARYLGDLVDSDGGRKHRTCVRCMPTNMYAACSGGVVGLSSGDVDSCGDVPQYKVMKYLVFGIISTSLLRRICTRSTVFYKCFLRTSTRTHMSAHAHAR